MSALETTGVIVGIVVGIAGLLAAVVAMWAALNPRPDKVSTRIERFVDIRRSVAQRRPELNRLALRLHAANVHPDLPSVLTSPRMRPAQPLPLTRLRIVMRRAGQLPPVSVPRRRRVRRMLPPQRSGAPVATYSEAIELHAKPALWNDLATYRVVSVDLAGANPEIQVGISSFFLGVDISELLGHELAAGSRGRRRDRPATYPIRYRLGSPVDLAARNVLTAVSALTLRVSGDRSTFFLHERDRSKVALAGGMMHLAPSGVYQPSADDPTTIDRDKSPWLTLCREFAEEYLGVDEARGLAGAQLSYEWDEPYASINTAYESGEIRAHVLFMGLDPVSLCPELVTLVTIGASAFDRIFGSMVQRNDEGEFRGARIASGRLIGFDFDESTIAYLTASDRLTPTASSALMYAWAHRDVVISLYPDA